MKRILALVLALTMLVGVMAGCSGAPEETKPQQTQAQAQGDAPATGKQLTGKWSTGLCTTKWSRRQRLLLRLPRCS